MKIQINTGHNIEGHEELAADVKATLSKSLNHLNPRSWGDPHDRTVIGGPNTQNEMCFNFMVVVPAEAAAECGGVF